MKINSELAQQVIAISERAATAIMAIYRQADFDVRSKSDESPITAADLAGHNTIVAGLQQLTPQIPILSEESTEIPWSVRRNWYRFWLVDPLDGTKEFIKRTDEFTINIALIEGGKPVLGVVQAPALNALFWGVSGIGAFKREAGIERRIHVVVPPQRRRLVASKSHLNAETQAYIDAQGAVDLVQAGSSLKFCRIAEGSADLYPRFGPTCEWDTGAAHAVLAAAGGQCVRAADGLPLQYGKADLLNPFFIAGGVI